MPFSLTAYLAGAGTVVGALALGFGSGIVLTNTAIKGTPAGPTRMERVARPEPVALEAKAIPLAPADPAPAVKPVAEPDPAMQPPPAAAVPKDTPPATEVERSKQAELTKQTEAEQRRAARRKLDRQKRYAERKAREVATRMKQRQWEEQGEPASPELAYRDEEPRFNPYRRNAPLYVAPIDPRDY